MSGTAPAGPGPFWQEPQHRHARHNCTLPQGRLLGEFENSTFSGKAARPQKPSLRAAHEVSGLGELATAYSVRGSLVRERPAKPARQFRYEFSALPARKNSARTLAGSGLSGIIGKARIPFARPPSGEPRNACHVDPRKTA